MLTTSVSLPIDQVSFWRSRHRKIMRLVPQMLRSQLLRLSPRRGVPRTYNRNAGKMAIVTTRFTETEYDVLHSAAAAFRVSVSWLIYCLIQLWLKSDSPKRTTLSPTNYFFAPRKSDGNSLIFTEGIILSEGIPRKKTTS